VTQATTERSSASIAKATAPAPPPDSGAPALLEPAPVDFDSPQLTLRSIITSIVLGGTLSICNIYTGLKIGWGLNMSITGILLAFAFWYAVAKVYNTRMYGKLENNVSQSAISAAGAVSSAGLVSAIPALTLINGTVLPWWQLTLWVTSVCFVGIAVAMGLRRQMIIVDKLPFPGGLACAQTLKEIYNTGSEALKRVSMLGVGALLGGGLKLVDILRGIAAKQAGGPAIVPNDFGLTLFGKPAGATFGFALENTGLMMAVGGLVGIRAGISILLGAALGWVVIGQQLLERDLAKDRASIGSWILWPGVTLMVVASLTSFAFSAPAIVRSFKRTGAVTDPAEAVDTGEVSRAWFLRSLVLALILAVILQTVFFGIAWWAAAIAVLLSFALAVVASRVSGETNVTPVGPMGKVTQLLFAGIIPASPAANLMTANVTAGAASQCADLMHDLKCGYLLGGIARKQVIAQILGAVVGSLVACAFYQILIPRPQEQLLTPEWPAPAVVQWKAVADVFAKGFDALPVGAIPAILVAAAMGVILPVLEKVLPKKAAVWVPSAASVGLAFVIPAWNGISMFLGALIGVGLKAAFPTWKERFFVTLCAGVIAGESLVGAGDAIRLVLQGTAAP
jgi:putative OPT family oligopeptide transporter